MGHLTTTSLPAYARAQVGSGERMVATHTPDDSGCCRRCGRPAPCDVAVQGRLLVAHFAALAGTDGQRSATGQAVEG
jgi:hypothetical protein